MTDDAVADRRFGPRGVPVAELTDTELLEEVHARRNRRRGVAADEGARPPDRALSSAAMPQQVRQWLANLELEASADLKEVEHAYDRLLARYGPAAEHPDPARRTTARALLTSLKQAHEGLQLFFSRER